MKKAVLSFLIILSVQVSFGQNPSILAGLLAYYQLNGDVLDSSGNGRDLTLRFAASYGQGRNSSDGRQAIVLDGSNRADYFTSSTRLSTDYTISMWINPGSISYNFPEWTYLANNVYGSFPSSRPNGEEMALRYGNNTNADTSYYNYQQFGWTTLTQFEANKWQNITLTQDDSQWSLYYDGILQKTENIGTLEFSVDNYYLFNAGGYNYGLVGMAQDVYLFDRALSAGEVATLVGVSIPEPSTLSLLAVGLGIFLQRRLRNA